MRDEKGANGPEHLKNGTGRLHLDQLPNFVQYLWSTPTAHDERRPGADIHSTQGANLSRDAALWTTPSAGDGLRGGVITEAMSGSSLTQQVNTLWASPRAIEGEKGGKWQKSGSSPAVKTLTGQALDLEAYTSANIWPTPTAMNRPRSDETLEKCRAIRKAKAGQNTVPLYLEDLASRISLPVPETSKDGAQFSDERRSLNPLFVEWLMGWPPGWTLLVWTDFACSATELSRYRQRMRSALSQLALPAEAPPAQLALFG
ncbi:hypothetical protein ACVCNR_00735 [Aquamicrobium terrae]